MALPRFHKLSFDRRHRLIAAAAVEFAARGYKGAALEAIAEKAGIGKSSFYYYFSDKADLCQTVLDEAWRRLGLSGRIDLATLTRESFWTTLEDAARQNLRACTEDPWLVAAARLLNRSISDSSGEVVLAEYLEKRRDWEVAWIARGQELGVVRTDVPADLLATISLNARQASNLWLLDRMDTVGIEETNRLALLLLGIQRIMLAPPESA
jgi:AcrR family transcriptional regulator